MSPQMTTPKQQAFELGMHSAFKKAGVQTRKQAETLFKIAGDILAQRRGLEVSRAAFELGLRKVAADHGLLSADEQDAFVEAAKKVAAGGAVAHKKLSQEKAAAGLNPAGASALTGALAGTGLLGATVAGASTGQAAGMFRPKDKGEGRLRAILRSQLTGTATGLGVGAGGVVGGLVAARKMLSPRARVLAALLGAGVGGNAAFQLTKRAPNPPGILDQIKTKITKKAGFLGLGGTSAGDDVGNISKGIKGLAGKARQSIKDHPTIAAALAALVAGGLAGSHIQKNRDQNKLAALRFLANHAEEVKDKATSGAKAVGATAKELRDYVMAKLGK